eukprot:SAG31_NODE_2097_length_6453_cov_16.072867_11_plen_155_part_01
MLRIARVRPPLSEDQDIHGDKVRASYIVDHERLIDAIHLDARCEELLFRICIARVARLTAEQGRAKLAHAGGGARTLGGDEAQAGQEQRSDDRLGAHLRGRGGCGGAGERGAGVGGEGGGGGGGGGLLRRSPAPGRGGGHPGRQGARGGGGRGAA